MKLTINKQDAIDMFSEKYPDTEIEDVTFVDQDGKELSVIEVTESKPETMVDTAEVDDEEDYEDDGLDIDASPKDFVASTGIAKILKKALEDQGYKSRIPNNTTEVCEDAAEDFIGKLRRRDKRIVVNIMNTKGIKKFLILWQDYQNHIHKKL